ncbi:hypothetical protein AX15_001452 [Amanita polypyramis BW_CC]|nr:hypothetical protein AX15_001452 [Amanita polypyramis BW_CC]
MHPDATRLAHLPPPQRAAFAVAGRLISCLVTEALLRALFFPLARSDASGFALILYNDPNADLAPPISATCQITDVFAIVPLQFIPVLTEHDGNRAINLLDPLDMIPLVFVVSDSKKEANGQPRSCIVEYKNQHTDLDAAILDTLKKSGWLAQTTAKLETCWDPIYLWESYARYANLSINLTEEIAHEFSSSFKWQAYAYQHPPKAPEFDSSSIEWEQSIVEGHPTHPMHKTRYFLPPLPDYEPGTYDLYHANLRLVSIPKSQLRITNDFESYVKPIVDAAWRNAGTRPIVPSNHLILPVHELQVVHIRDKFPNVDILPAKFMVSILAQQSVRTVQVPDACVDLSLKLGIGLKLTSAVRTISPASAYFGPRFSAQVVPYLQLDRNIVTVANELASVIHAHPDGEVAKHCAAIVREAHENASDQRGEKVIVCSALVESGHLGEEGHLPAVIRLFNLNTEDKRILWLDRFVQVFLQAFLPSVINNGVAFECHPQNCLARFDLKSKELRGFIIRDFGGLRVHPSTLYATTGIKLDCLRGHSIVAPDLDDVYIRMYHTVIQNHLQQLIRVLGLHHNGRGWEVVRKHLMQIIPRDHGLYKAWLFPERKMVLSKCFLRMRITGMYRFHAHSPVPNLILHRGSNKTGCSRILDV